MAFYYEKSTGKIYNTDLPGVIPSITEDYVLIDETIYYKLLSETYTDSSKTLTFDTETNSITLSNVSPPSLSENELIGQFYGGVYGFMNSQAFSFGYDSVQDAISYYNSGITAWRDEAIAFSTWRDNTVSLMYDNIFSFTADGTPLPSLTSGAFTGQAGYTGISVSPSRPQLFS